MYQDFNPLDLSAPKKPVLDKQEDKTAPVKVYKVGHGSLLHSRFTKVLVTLMLIALAGIGSYVATLYYLDKNPIEVKNNSDNNKPNSNSSGTNQVETKTTEAIYCGVAGMPEDVCKAITLIEKDGFTDNSYVTADTSTLSKTAKLEIKKDSWKKTDDNNGNIVIDLNDNGRITTGVGIFTKKDSSWKLMEIKI